METHLTPIARKLRADPTEAEKLLWQQLRGSRLEGAKFVRQFPVERYVADFACRAARLVVELDGGQHADSATNADRTRAIEAAGYTVLRFWNNEVLANPEGVLQEIARTLRLAHNR